MSRDHRAYNKKYYGKNKSRERARVDKWVAENKEHRTAYMKKWRADNREHRNESLRDWTDQNPEAYRRIWKSRTFKHRCKKRGITVEQYYKMLADQGGGCAVCGCDSIQNGRMLAIDHDHDTGEVRGLLCHHCNAALGHMRDDPVLLGRLIAYLKKG